MGEIEDDDNTNTGQRSHSTRHQAVLSLDFETWQELVEVFRIEESLIPDRSGDRQAATQIGARGWYA